MQPLPANGIASNLIRLPVASLISEPVGDMALSTFVAFDVKAVVFVLMTVLPL